MDCGGPRQYPARLIAGVDFDMVESEVVLDEPWKRKYDLKAISRAELLVAIKQHNNVVKENRAVLRVVKEAAQA